MGYNPEQLRDKNGQWTKEASNSGSAEKKA